MKVERHLQQRYEWGRDLAEQDQIAGVADMVDGPPLDILFVSKDEEPRSR
jgi:hypothetical protein